MKRWARTVLGGLAIWWLGASAVAAQYIVPGSTLSENDIPERDLFAEAYEAARWDFGGVRVDPWFSIHDASFVSTVGQDGRTETDFTIAAGAGLRAYLRTGPKVFVTAQALPEYVWWQDNSAKSRVNGRFGAGVFAYFNRLRIEVSARRNEIQSFFSSEVQELTTNRNDIGRAVVEVDLTDRIRLSGSYERSDIGNQENENPIFSRLDRVRDSTTLGLGYQIGDRWSAALGFVHQESSFSRQSRRLSNSGDFVSLKVDFEANRFAGRLFLRDESLEPEAGSEFPGFDDLTGSLELQWQLRRNMSLFAYGRRQLLYSIDDLHSHYLSDRQGLRLNFGAGQSQLAFFAESGQDDFEPLTDLDPARRDDVTSYGLELRLNLLRWTGLAVRVIRTEYNSDNDLFDREVTQVTGSLELGRLFERFSLGQRSPVW